MTIAGGPIIAIMKPGTFIAESGRSVAFTNADLAAVVASYDAVADPAPLVIGHPKMDHPAYGWVKSLHIDGDRLVATPEKIVPEFAEAVRAGQYRKVSASFYPPDNPNNPKPGSFYLKHIGFLGAAAPAVKGLGTVAFSQADDGGLVTVSRDMEPPPRSCFTAPCGRAMSWDAHDLANRAKAVQAEHAHLSFADAVKVACIDVALDAQVINFGSGELPSAEAEARTLYRFVRAKAIDPTLTFDQAMRSARSAC